MLPKITAITTPFVFNISVNCYLVRTNTGYILIDTGMPSQRRAIVQELELAGCQPGSLKQIILTHGDIDHCGNAAYLRQKFGTTIAMHYDDFGMVEHGDMFWNRQEPNSLIRIIFELFFSLGKPDQFKPDLDLKDGSDLSDYGFNAKVLYIPGHSKGSIGILTNVGDLFCGDLLTNFKQPDRGIIDDPIAADASTNRLQGLKINTVYPGHGKPFLMEQFVNSIS
jgi:hydroxyacylglutathione hydrolase